MLRYIGQRLLNSWRTLVLADLLFKAFLFVLITPSLSLLFRLSLALAGRQVVADMDIIAFAVHPVGFVAVVLFGAATVAVLAVEQAVLIAAWLATSRGIDLRVSSAIAFAFGKIKSIFLVAVALVLRIIAVAVPFLVVAFLCYLLLLGDHDINFYLAEKPPQFWLATALIGTLLAVMAAILIRLLINYSIAIQLTLFEGYSPVNSLAESRHRLAGRRLTITKWWLAWAAAQFALSTVLAALIFWAGNILVPLASVSLWVLVIVLGLILSAWVISNAAVSLFAAITAAALLAGAYERFAMSSTAQLPTGGFVLAVPGFRLTAGRVAAASVIAVLAAGLVGVTSLHSIRLADDVEVTAHRGASGRAPENSIAAVRQAILDDADWVEIDVQETKDGVVVVVHDSDLKKVAGSEIKVWQATMNDLQSIDIGSSFAPNFAEQRIPTLKEVLQTCRGKVGVNIELKYYGHDQSLERRVIRLVEQHGMAEDVVIMSLKMPGVQKIKNLRPDWKVGLLSAVAVGDLTRAKVDFLAVNTKLATRPFIRSAHRRGKEVHVWTVNDAATMSSMISRGADNLITDHPALARKVIQERASMSPIERLLVELAVFFDASPTSELRP